MKENEVKSGGASVPLLTIPPDKQSLHHAPASPIMRPLDFSFQEIKAFSELAQKEPSSGTKKQLESKTQETKSSESTDLELQVSSPRGKSGPIKRKCQADKHSGPTTALKLAYNKIDNWMGFGEALEAVLDDPSQLEWLDLSYNGLSTIDPVLLNYPKLRSLNLHVNNLTHLSCINKLAKLPHLVKLSLHGNEALVKKKFYRLYIIDALPQLKSLDFIPITPQDRQDAATYRRVYKKKQGEAVQMPTSPVHQRQLSSMSKA